MMKAVQRLIWGYLFLYIDITINGIDLLPSWISYILFFKAITLLEKEDSTIHLLKPLAYLLGFYNLITWPLSNGSFPIFSSLNAVISLYFQFQLLTNIADIMKKNNCSQDKKILFFRTAQTLVITLVSLPITFFEIKMIAFMIIIIQLITMIGITIVLYQFKFELQSKNLS